MRPERTSVAADSYVSFSTRMNNNRRPDPRASEKRRPGPEPLEPLGMRPEDRTTIVAAAVDVVQSPFEIRPQLSRHTRPRIPRLRLKCKLSTPCRLRPLGMETPGADFGELAAGSQELPGFEAPRRKDRTPLNSNNEDMTLMPPPTVRIVFKELRCCVRRSYQTSLPVDRRETQPRRERRPGERVGRAECSATIKPAPQRQLDLHPDDN
jgi:hypothetical protein